MRACEILDQRRQEGFRGGVDPVQVLDGKHERVLLTASEVDVPERLEGSGFAHLRAEVGQSIASDLQAQELEHIRSALLRIHRCGLQGQPYLRRNHFWCIGLGHAAVLPEQGEHGHQGDGLSIRQALSLHIRDRLRPQVVMELIEESGLPDARLPHDPHHLSPALCGLCQQVGQGDQLPLPSHESTQRPRLRAGAVAMTAA